MKIVLISNYFNHHQYELAEYLYQLTNKRFSFISTKTMRDERKKLGYIEYSEIDYVIKNYSEDEDNALVLDCLNTSDIVISGSCDEKYLKNRIKERKLLFRYSERPLKKGNSVFKYIPRLLRFYKNNPKNANIYMLCASAYTSYDYSKFGLFHNKCFKWGYFPTCVEYENINDLLKNKNSKEILWCGRLIDWKHPEYLVEIAKRLKENNFDFKIKIIGTGYLEQTLSEMIDRYNLNDNVCLLGSMSPQMVRKEMERAGIFLFTSDFNEGWGAVLNEAMNSGCATVSSHAIGSVPYLINNKKNGLVFESGNIDELYSKVKLLLDNPGFQYEIGKKAYETITEEWNAKVAANRLIEIGKMIINNEDALSRFKSGPCSKAEIITDNWYKYGE